MIPKDYKHTELGILPRHWEVVRLGEVCDVQMCKRIFSHQTCQDFGIPFFKIGTLGGIPDSFISRELFEQYKSKYNFPQKGEVIITCSGTIGKCIQYNGEDAYFQDSNIVWLHNEHKEILCNNFILIVLSNQDWSVLSSTTITRLYTSDLKNLQIPLPPLAEQEKIAEILSTWDTQIQNLCSLIKEKQTLKKALCQTLLTAKTRFKGFDEDWEVMRLGEVAKITMGTSPKSEFYNQDFKGLPLIQGKNDALGKKSLTTTYTQKSLRECQEGDILMSVRAPIGFVFLASEKSSIGRGVCAIQSKQNQDFLFHILDSLQNKWVKIGQGSTFTAINKSDIFEFQLTLPSFTEQNKIAQVLSEADNEIKLLEQKLESLKFQKKGLMQKLLNGKVRVK